MNKVLILTCSTGEGHNSAARAIESALLLANIPCEIADPVAFQSERMQHAVSSIYNNMIKKTPSVFGAIYKIGDFYAHTKLPSPVYWANAQYAEALRAYISDHAFDAVVCTHLYGMEVMTAIRQDPQFTIPCYGVLTDYVCIPFLEDTRLDGYFVPTEETKQELIEKGINSDHIFISGIPVDHVFSDPLDQTHARQRLSIPAEEKMYLIMTGGVGCENMMGLCDHMLQSLKAEGKIYILTGKNDSLKQKIDERYNRNKQITTVPFTRDVATYMAASDVLISKPGGLSSTEAAVANVPIVHVHAIPGCETYNAHFFSEHGLSMYAKSESEAASYANQLVYDAEKARTMQKMQREMIPKNAANRIVKEICRQ